MYIYFNFTDPFEFSSFINNNANYCFEMLTDPQHENKIIFLNEKSDNTE